MRRETRSTDHEPRVVAAFPSLEAARTAVGSLERAGIVGAAIDTHGPQDRATDRARAREEGAMRHAGWRLGIGLAIGAILGALVGVVIAFAVGRAGILAVVGCTLAGLALGAFLGGEEGLDADPNWELAFDDGGEAPVMLEVRGDRELRRRAVELLRSEEPLALTTVERADEERRSA